MVSAVWAGVQTKNWLSWQQVIHKSILGYKSLIFEYVLLGPPGHIQTLPAVDVSVINLFIFADVECP